MNKYQQKYCEEIRTAIEELDKDTPNIPAMFLGWMPEKKSGTMQIISNGEVIRQTILMFAYLAEIRVHITSKERDQLDEAIRRLGESVTAGATRENILAPLQMMAAMGRH